MIKGSLLGLAKSAFALSVLTLGMGGTANAQGGQPAACQDITQACATKNPIKQHIRREKIRELYAGLIFPANVGILADTSLVNEIFQEGSSGGRVTPAGGFGDFEAAIEYFYGLSSSPASRADGVKFRSLVSSGDKVAVEVDIHFCNAPLDQPQLIALCDAENIPSDGGLNTTFRQTGFFTFNGEDRVISFDLSLLNLGQTSDPTDPASAQQRVVDTCIALTTAHFDLINQAPVFNGTCTEFFDDASDYPAGFPLSGDPLSDCIAFMSSIPYGSFDRAESNSFTCRSLHTLITGLRPEVHCPHASPSGGGVCEDKPLSEFFAVEF